MFESGIPAILPANRREEKALPFFIKISLFIFCLIYCFQIQGQELRIDSQELERRFQLGLKFQYASNNDSSRIIFEELLASLKGQNMGDSHLALKAELELANHLIKFERDYATSRLFSLIHKAQAQQDWEVVASAHLSLALAHELLGNVEKCLENLNIGRGLIQKHKLTNIYTRYAIRRCSYFRVFKVDMDSALYYAEEAERTLAEGPSASRAAVYLLFPLLKKDMDTKQKIEYFKKADEIFLGFRNYSSHINMLKNIFEIYFQSFQYDSAEIYLDAALAVSYGLKPPFKYEFYSSRSALLWSKAALFEVTGRKDSVWKYIELYKQAETKFNDTKNAKTVAEVEAKYFDVDKTRKIEAQNRQLRDERRIRNLAITGLIAVMILALVLYYLYQQIRLANNKIKEQAERLSQLDQAKSRFFANISHELRTPLTLMLGPISNVLDSGTLTGQQKMLLQMANKSGIQLQSLINEILTLRKLESGQLSLNLQKISLGRFFNVYVPQFESLAISQSIDFEYETTLNDRMHAMLDIDKCRQILNNLLSNAFKYTPDGGRISIEVFHSEEKLHINVSDSGEGIHPDDLPYVFDRFFQTHRPEKPVEGGTGIGLALCKEYVDLFGGQIGVKSSLDGGTSFFLSFPLEIWEEETGEVETDKENNKEQVQMEEIPSSPTGLDQQRHHLLLVEDNPELVTYLRLILSDEYEIEWAENGKKALEYLVAQKGKPRKAVDLIISDLMMPVMDGFQMVDELKSRDDLRHIPVVMLTARANFKDKLKALRIGVDDYLLKPFEEEELKVRIANLLRNKASRKEYLNPVQDEKKSKNHRSEEEEKWMASLEQFVQKNLGNPLLSIPMLAEEFAMSESTLLRHVKKLIGLSPSQYIQELRLAKAREILESGSFISISSLAYEAGYGDTRSFSRAFKRRFGKLPSSFVRS